MTGANPNMHQVGASRAHGQGAWQAPTASSWAPMPQGQIPRDPQGRCITQAQTLALTPTDDPS